MRAAASRAERVMESTPPPFVTMTFAEPEDPSLLGNSESADATAPDDDRHWRKPERYASDANSFSD